VSTGERKAKWVIMTDFIENDYAQRLLEAAKNEGFRIRLTNVVSEPSDYTIEFAGVFGLILCLHGPWGLSELVTDFIQSLHKRNGVAIIATRSSRFENLRPWFSSIGVRSHWPVVKSAPDGSMQDYFSIEDVLMIMSHVSFS
jgi:hypothetical protein